MFPHSGWALHVWKMILYIVYKCFGNIILSEVPAFSVLVLRVIFATGSLSVIRLASHNSSYEHAFAFQFPAQNFGFLSNLPVQSLSQNL